MFLKRLIVLFVLILVAADAAPVEQPLEKLTLETKYSWLAVRNWEQLQVVLAVHNIGERVADVPGQFLWTVNYIPDSSSVKRMESKEDSVKHWVESERNAGRTLHFRDGPQYPRLMNFQIPQEKPRLRLSTGEAMRDTLLFDAIRSSYREWPGVIRVDWQFGLGWVSNERPIQTITIPLDSLRLCIPVP